MIQACSECGHGPGSFDGRCIDCAAASHPKRPAWHHDSGCNCRDCSEAHLWQGAIVCVAGAVLFVSGLVAAYRAGLFAWLTN